MRVLVTGSTGFVGAYTVAEALHAGTPLDRGWAARRLEIRVVDGS